MTQSSVVLEPPLVVQRGITTSELTVALREAGLLGQDTSVAEFTSGRIGVGVGFAGRIDRLVLKYEGEVGNPPETLILKQGSDVRDIREAVAEFDAYDHEALFYNELANETKIPTPACYFADSDNEGNIRIVLEDLGDGTTMDQLQGATPEEARTIIAALATYHAGWWRSEQLGSLDWLIPTEELARKGIEAFKDALPGFTEEAEEDFPELNRLAHKLSGLIDDNVEDMLRPPKNYTLLHGDFRLDNILLSPSRPGELIVADWQGAALGPGPRDLARFVAISLTPEARREVQGDLLKLYHETLVQHGVEGYSMRSLRNDFNLGLINELAFAVVLAGMDLGRNLGGAEERAEALRTTIAGRLESALVDNKINRIILAGSWVIRFQKAGRRVRALLRFGRN